MARSLPSAYRYRSTEKILMPPNCRSSAQRSACLPRSFASIASMATWSRWTCRRTTTPMCCVSCNRRHKGCGAEGEALERRTPPRRAAGMCGGGAND